MRLSLPLAVFLLGLVLPLTALRGQTRIADINQFTEERSSEPTDYVVSGPLAFFVADDGLGEELWVTDGSAAGTRLTRDILVGEDGSGPSEIVDLDGAGRVVFRAFDRTAGLELWVSDGTTAGTTLLADILPGIETSQPTGLFRAGSQVFFSADDGASGRELWVTDGTAPGTRQVADLAPGGGGSIRNFDDFGVALGGLAIFEATTPAAGNELWVSDGTAAGTSLLGDLTPGTTSTSIQLFGLVGSEVYFQTGFGGLYELWKTDGTASGTLLVSGIPARAGAWTDLNGSLIFSVGNDLWRSDGTASSTRALSTIGLRPFQLVTLGNEVFFASLATANRGVWKTDGTAAGTTFLVDPLPASFNQLNQLVVASGRLVFDVAGSGYQIWTSDGTVAGTRIAVNLLPGLNHLYAHYVTPWPQQNKLLLTLYAPDDGGEEPWITDLTVPGTRRLADVAPPTGRGSRVYSATTLGDSFYFVANDEIVGNELWRGDESGAQLVVDVLPGRGGSIPTYLMTWNGSIYFNAFVAAAQPTLFRSDGTAAGTVAIASIGLTSRPVEFRGELYFGGGSAGDTELWKTDGTAAGTVRVADVRPGALGSRPDELTVAGDRLFFTATEPTAGAELWSTDGSAAGTQRVTDLIPGPSSSTPRGLRAIGSGLMFAASGPNVGRELFHVDATTLQVRLVKDLEPGPASSGPVSFVVFGGRLFFEAFTSNERYELWVSDGTAAGTVNFALSPGPTSSQPRDLVVLSHGVLFIAYDGSGVGIWLSDGTRAGTSMVVPGSTSGFQLSGLVRIGVDDIVLYRGDRRDGQGSELMVTDGTPAGTRRVAALNPFGDSQPIVLARNGRKVLFSADDGTTGVEPWILDVATIGAAVADGYGSGCPASSGTVPLLATVGVPVVGNATFAIELSSAPANRPAATLFGLLPAGTGPTPCQLLVGAPLLLDSGTTDATGRFVSPLSVPTDPALVGAELFTQGLAVDPALPGLPITLSAGLHLVVGR